MKTKTYEEKRDALIKEAEMHANQQAGRRSDGENTPWAFRWNRAFHTRMDELARGGGLVGAKERAEAKQ